MGTAGTLGAWGFQEHKDIEPTGYTSGREGTETLGAWGCQEHKDTEPTGYTKHGPAALLCPIAPLVPQVTSPSPLRTEGLRNPFQPHSQRPQTHPLSCAGREDSWDPAVPHQAQSHHWHRSLRSLSWVTQSCDTGRRCHSPVCHNSSEGRAIYSSAGETEAPGNPNERSDTVASLRAL